jgi:hypothetical protein
MVTDTVCVKFEGHTGIVWQCMVTDTVCVKFKGHTGIVWPNICSCVSCTVASVKQVLDPAGCMHTATPGHTLAGV